jgi:P-loop containing dynein motor region
MAHKPINKCPSGVAVQMEAPMERRRKDVYGPPVGRPCTVFVDDVSMLQPEKYGALPALELLRQWLDHGVRQAFFTDPTVGALCGNGDVVTGL